MAFFTRIWGWRISSGKSKPVCCPCKTNKELDFVVQVFDDKVEFFVKLMQHSGFKAIVEEPSTETHLDVSGEGSSIAVVK